MLVAFFHLEPHIYGHFHDSSFVNGSYLFVDFFFVLSGFVISHAYLDRLGGWPQVKEFVLRRFGRLWPLHAAMLGLLALLGFYLPAPPTFAAPTDLGMLLPNLLLIHGLGFPRLSWNFPSWSISTEFGVYLLFALLCAFAAGRRGIMRLAGPALAALGFGLTLLAMENDIRLRPEALFFRCLYGFFVGQCVHSIWKSGAPRLGRGPVPEVLAVAAVCLFVTLCGSGRWSIMAPLVFAPAVWVFAQEGGPLSRALSVPAAARLGAWSYSIYMVHPAVLQLSGNVFGAAGLLQEKTIAPGVTALTISFAGKWGGDLAALVYLAAVVSVSALSYRFIERPAGAFFYRLASGSAPAEEGRSGQT